VTTSREPSAQELIEHCNRYLREATTQTQVEGWISTLTAYGNTLPKGLEARMVAHTLAKLGLAKKMLGPFVVERLPTGVRSNKKGR
jgi:hypothetical protein